MMARRSYRSIDHENQYEEERSATHPLEKWGEEQQSQLQRPGIIACIFMDACKALNRKHLSQLRLKECFCGIEKRVTLVFGSRMD